jgi:hypothetical protein
MMKWMAMRPSDTVGTLSVMGRLGARDILSLLWPLGLSHGLRFLIPTAPVRRECEDG